MSVSDDAEDFIVTEWMAALDDAGVPGDAFHLIVCAGAPVTGHPKGVSFRPGERLTGAEDEGGIVVGVNKLAEANGESVVTRHRVAVLEDIDPDAEVEIAYLAAVLRHEIEHAKQRLVADDAFDLYGLVDQVIELVCDGDPDRRRDLQNAQPIEADAHAAASAYVRRRYPNAVAKLLDSDDAYLVEPTDPPGPSEELVARTVEFLHEFASTVDDPINLEGIGSFADLLEDRLPGSSAYWLSLESGA